MEPKNLKITKGVASEIDILLGNKIRAIRLLRGLSQEYVASHLGITFQQLQKYETGKNRISAARLLKMSAILNVNVAELLSLPENQEGDPLKDPNVLRLLKAYAWIKTDEHKKKFVSTTLSIAENLEK